MKAVLKNGVVSLQEPVPKDWTDGTELRVEKAIPETTDSGDELDRWMAAVQASADHTDADDEVILEKTIREVRRQARDQARKDAEKA